MSETKFTPGKWNIGNTPDRYNANIIFGEDESGICQVYGLPMQERLYKIKAFPGIEQKLANLYLIAAAPELYAALESIKDMLGPDSDYAIHRIDGKSIYLAEGVSVEHVLEKASSALARARGEA